MDTVHDPLAALDLNLVRALDVLLEERHVTRAAARLGVTQSAASHALARLRDELGDPLLVRGVGGGLSLTERAARLAPVVRAALAQLAAAWREPVFEPASSQRTFHVGAGDFAELVLLPPLVRRIATAAPGVNLFFRAVTDGGPELAAGKLDAYLAPAREPSAGLYQRHLFDESFVVMMRAGHPAASSKLTLERFCALDHLLVAPRGTPGGYVDEALAQLGLSRRVALSVPHFLIAPHVVASTDLVMTVAWRIAAAFRKSHALVVREPPLTLPTFPIHLVWHERTHAEPAHRWLREQVIACAPRSRGSRGAARGGELADADAAL